MRIGALRSFVWGVVRYVHYRFLCALIPLITNRIVADLVSNMYCIASIIIGSFLRSKTIHSCLVSTLSISRERPINLENGLLGRYQMPGDVGLSLGAFF